MSINKIANIEKAIEDIKTDIDKYDNLIECLSSFENEDAYRHYILKRNDAMTLLLLLKQRRLELRVE